MAALASAALRLRHGKWQNQEGWDGGTVGARASASGLELCQHPGVADGGVLGSVVGFWGMQASGLIW